MSQNLERAFDLAPTSGWGTSKSNIPGVEQIAEVLSAQESVMVVLKTMSSEKRANGTYFNKRMCAAVVTDRSIYLVKQGEFVKALGKGFESIPLKTITGISISKGLFGSTVEITRAANIDVLGGHNHEHAEIWVRAARETIQRANSSANPELEKGSADPLDQLVKLKDLLDAGVLTQEEFDSKKLELLGKI